MTLDELQKIVGDRDKAPWVHYKRGAENLIHNFRGGNVCSLGFESDDPNSKFIATFGTLADEIMEVLQNSADCMMTGIVTPQYRNSVVKLKVKLAELK